MTKDSDDYARSKFDPEERVRGIELLISDLLRAGVIVSLTLIVVGTIVSFIRHPDYVTDPSTLGYLTQPGAAFPHTLHDLVAALRDMRGQAIVTLGLLVLIATPVIRVGVSIFVFIYEGDRIYTFITVLVFCLLMLSFVLGKVE